MEPSTANGTKGSRGAFPRWAASLLGAVAGSLIGGIGGVVLPIAVFVFLSAIGADDSASVALPLFWLVFAPSGFVAGALSGGLAGGFWARPKAAAISLWGGVGSALAPMLAVGMVASISAVPWGTPGRTEVEFLVTLLAGGLIGGSVFFPLGMAALGGSAWRSGGPAWRALAACAGGLVAALAVVSFVLASM